MGFLLSFLLCFLAAGRSGGELIRAGRSSLFHVSLPPRPDQTGQAAVRLITRLGGQTGSQGVEGVVFFSSLFQENLNTWQIRLGEGQQSRTETTLCFDPLSPPHSPAEYVSVAAFSQLSEDQNFDIYAEWDSRFLLGPGSGPRLLSLADDSPQVIQFPTSPESHYLLLVESQEPANDYKCMYVGINQPGCPWHNDLASVTTSRLWSRVLNIGYFPIKSEDFPHSFTVSLITLRNSSECYSENISTEAEKSYKNVKISLQKLESDYLVPILVSKLGILFCSLLFFAVWIFLWYSQLKYNQTVLKSQNWSSSSDSELLDITTGRTAENLARKASTFCDINSQHFLFN